MTKRPRLLDLFCCAGGAAMGYHRAGFEVVGVDIKPQPHYPFEFHQADALEYPLEGFDAYHASPPCPEYSLAAQQWRNAGREYPDLIAPIRARLRDTGRPYVIENVPGAPLIDPLKLNGAMFGMRIRRVRLFECSFDTPLILLPTEQRSAFRMRRVPRDGEPITPVGHFSGVKIVRREMGIDWMTQKELAQAIPPAYTEYIGGWLMKYIQEQVML